MQERAPLGQTHERRSGENESASAMKTLGSRRLASLVDSSFLFALVTQRWASAYNFL